MKRGWAFAYVQLQDAIASCIKHEAGAEQQTHQVQSTVACWANNMHGMQACTANNMTREPAGLLPNQQGAIVLTLDAHIHCNHRPAASLVINHTAQAMC